VGKFNKVVNAVKIAAKGKIAVCGYSVAVVRQYPVSVSFDDSHLCSVARLRFWLLLIGITLTYSAIRLTILAKICTADS
jgi:hypothetical protein